MSERTTRIQLLMGPGFRAAFNVRSYRKRSELDEIREAQRDAEQEMLDEARKKMLRGDQSMDLNFANIANAARKGMSTRQKVGRTGAQDGHDCYEGHSHYEPFGEAEPETAGKDGSVFRNLLKESSKVQESAAAQEDHTCYEGHSHYEPLSSAEGAPTAAPEESIRTAQMPQRSSGQPFTREELRKSVIMSEVLGKPLALRRR